MFGVTWCRLHLISGLPHFAVVHQKRAVPELLQMLGRRGVRKKKNETSSLDSQVTVCMCFFHGFFPCIVYSQQNIIPEKSIVPFLSSPPRPCDSGHTEYWTGSTSDPLLFSFASSQRWTITFTVCRVRRYPRAHAIPHPPVYTFSLLTFKKGFFSTSLDLNVGRVEQTLLCRIVRQQRATKGSFVSSKFITAVP